MLEFLRRVKILVNRFSTMEVFGVPMDWFFHLVGAIVIFFAASRILSLKKSLFLTISLLVAKEIFDVFAKTKAEYIRPPTADLIFDMTAGLAGIGIGYLLAKKIPNWSSQRRVQ